MFTKLKNKSYRLLRRSERHTKTDNVYLAKGGFWLAFSQAFFLFCSFLLSIIFANYLPKAVYGTYKFILSLLGIFSLPLLGSLNTALTQAVARGYEGSYLFILKLKIKLGFIGSLSSWLLAGYYFWQGNQLLGAAFLIVGCFLPFFSSTNIYNDFLQGRRLFKKLTQLGILKELVISAITAVVVILTNNLFVILLAYFLLRSILNFFFFKLTYQKFPPNQKNDPRTVSYGVYLSLLGILQSLSSNVDQIIIWHFLGPASIAIYSFATLPVIYFRKFINGNLANLAFPKLSARPAEEIKKTLPKKVIIYFLAMIPLALCFIVLVPFFFKIFYPQYLEAVRYSRIFAFSIVLTPFSFFGNALLAKIKKKEIAIMRLIGPGSQIILYLILTPLYGILGIILGQLIGNVIHFSLGYFLFKKMKK